MMNTSTRGLCLRSRPSTRSAGLLLIMTCMLNLSLTGRVAGGLVPEVASHPDGVRVAKLFGSMTTSSPGKCPDWWQRLRERPPLQSTWLTLAGSHHLTYSCPCSRQSRPCREKDGSLWRIVAGTSQDKSWQCVLTNWSWSVTGQSGRPALATFRWQLTRPGMHLPPKLLEPMTTYVHYLCPLTHQEPESAPSLQPWLECHRHTSRNGRCQDLALPSGCCRRWWSSSRLQAAVTCGGSRRSSSALQIRELKSISSFQRSWSARSSSTDSTFVNFRHSRQSCGDSRCGRKYTESGCALVRARPVWTQRSVHCSWDGSLGEDRHWCARLCQNTSRHSSKNEAWSSKSDVKHERSETGQRKYQEHMQARDVDVAVKMASPRRGAARSDLSSFPQSVLAAVPAQDYLYFLVVTGPKSQTQDYLYFLVVTGPKSQVYAARVQTTTTVGGESTQSQSQGARVRSGSVVSNKSRPQFTQDYRYFLVVTGPKSHTQDYSYFLVVTGPKSQIYAVGCQSTSGWSSLGSERITVSNCLSECRCTCVGHLSSSAVKAARVDAWKRLVCLAISNGIAST